MRIIAGRLGGLNFDTPKSFKTHPMSEKMRGALFNILGDISDLSIFDSYGGSGALTYEAISRGAKKATIAEIDRQAINTIKNNIKLLKITAQVELISQNSAVWCESDPEVKFDLVICDPPYDDIKQSQLAKIAKKVVSGGLLVLSLPPNNERYNFDGFKLEVDKSYGDASLVFYRKI